MDFLKHKLKTAQINLLSAVKICYISGKISSTTSCKSPREKKCLWCYTELTYKSENSALVPALHEPLKTQSEVAFQRWPLNCAAYCCTVDSTSELLKPQWYFLLNSYFLRHLKWTVLHWKWKELFWKVVWNYTDWRSSIDKKPLFWLWMFK